MDSPEPEKSEDQLQHDTGDEVQDQRAPGRPGRHTPTIAQTQQPSPTPQPSATPGKPQTQQPSSTPLPSNTPRIEQSSSSPLPSFTPTSLTTATVTTSPRQDDRTFIDTSSATPLPSFTPTLMPTATWTMTSGQDTRMGTLETDLRMQEMALSAALIQQPGSVTIDYTYDGRYRLTAAEYSNGDYYRYTYDAVGNRLTQETIAETNTYTYDAANRMTSVDGVTYTWDANGNMLSDGVSTYTYNKANRLTGVTGASGTSSFAYNGLGDRYMQVINSVTTTYQLDLAAGLVNVLADGENTYLYGNTVVAQVSDTQTGYYLPDVLGSVRQMTSPTGEVQLSQRFTPYGEVKEKYGDVEANFGYTGQMYDEQTGLLYLRARYYAPGMGRFVSHDTWSGDSNMPMSYNAWLYGYGNPVKYTDPSGQIPFIPPPPPPPVNVYVKLSSSIPINQLNPPAQYYPAKNPHLNLCGQISLQMIYETITGTTDTLQNFINVHSSATGIGNLQLIERAIYPPGWVAKAYFGKEISVNTKSWLRLPLTKNWWVNQTTGQDQMRYIMYQILYRKHYIISSVVLDKSTGFVTSEPPSPDTDENKTRVKHWVVVTGIQGGMVKINNPFANREELVDWGTFNLSVIKSLGSMLEIYPWFIGEDEIDLKLEASKYRICP